MSVSTARPNVRAAPTRSPSNHAPAMPGTCSRPLRAVSCPSHRADIWCSSTRSAAQRGEERVLDTNDCSDLLRVHPLRWFQSDAYLIEIVGEYVLSGISSGDGIVLIMTHAHLQPLLALLKQSGLDVHRHVAAARLIMFDADFILQQITVWSADANGSVQLQLLEQHFHRVRANNSAYVPVRAAVMSMHVRSFCWSRVSHFSLLAARGRRY